MLVLIDQRILELRCIPITSTSVYYLRALLNPAASLPRHWSYGEHDEEYFDPADEDPDERWGIAEIAVAPEFQRRGGGTALIRWGQEHVRSEGVPITLASTEAGRRLYTSVGFRVCGHSQWAGAKKDPERQYDLMRCGIQMMAIAMRLKAKYSRCFVLLPRLECISL